jgi:class 3 adenylate cyclase
LDIYGWLEKLGLAQYDQLFRDNDVDIELLRRLSNDDLREIGVASFGHRKRLLEAISELANATSIAQQSPNSPRIQSPPERRQVTVMFSDLVGSTALSARMDPEDLRDVLSAYQASVAATVQRLGGFVAKYMGDGVLVYFGYPQAHEDDAERAVRAGLELVSEVAKLKTSELLQTRVGIATGLVVVGDLIGSGASQEQAIVGETPNLSARLQSVAEPNCVVISESTRRLVGNLFELQDLGLKDLKGIAGSTRAWGAVRPSSVESRFEAMHASELTGLVGREEEIQLLMRRWEESEAGTGRVVLLLGEGGIGKSRLTAALLNRLANQPHTRLRSFCSPQHTDSALYPIIGQLERAAGISRSDEAQTKLDKLDAMLRKSSASEEDAAIIADLLSLSNDGRYPALEMPPQQRRQKTLDALVSQIVALSRHSPLLIIFEDAHWTDPTTLELFNRLVNFVPSLPALLIVTFRPEFEPPWTGRAHVTSLVLSRLAEKEINAIIDAVSGSTQLSANTRHDIIERSDGIPLFIEEMARAVLEARDDQSAARVVTAVSPSSVAVPASLHASLLARLDRLGPGKDIVQVGSAIGREFSHALLSAVVQKPDQELATHLDRIVHAGLLLRQGLHSNATYLFKHALIQDAAYSTLLRAPRRALHAKIAAALEEDFPDLAENQPEILARHCAEAGLIGKAATLWGKAGERSLERSALIEATSQFTRGLELLATMPTSTEVRREQIKQQVALITPLIHIKGYSAPDTKAATDRARVLIEEAEKLGEPPDDPLMLFSVLYGLWYENLGAFNGDVLCDLSARLLALAEEQNSTIPLMVAHRLVGSSSLHTGDFRDSRVHYDQALSLYNVRQHSPLA